MKEKKKNMKKPHTVKFTRTKSLQTSNLVGNQCNKTVGILNKQQQQQQQCKLVNLSEHSASKSTENVPNVTGKKIRKHPCIVQYKKCNYGEYCLLREYPGDTCINYFNGTCLYGEFCKKKHSVDGVDIRESRRPVVNDKRIKLPSGETIIQTKLCGDHVYLGKSLVNAIDANDDFPTMEDWPLQSGQSNVVQEIAHTDPHALNWRLRMTLTNSEVQAPRPFLDAVRKQSSKCTASPLKLTQTEMGTSPLPKVTVVSPLPREKHPCVAQFGTCKYGKSCIHADRDADVCVFFLNGRCTRGSTCQYRHETNAEILRRVKPEVFARTPSQVITRSHSNTAPQEGQGEDEIQGQRLEEKPGKMDDNNNNDDAEEEEDEDEEWIQQPTRVMLSSFIPKMKNKEGLCANDGDCLLEEDNHPRSDEELEILITLIEVFPETEPSLLLHILRFAGGDPNLVGDTLSRLDGFGTAEDISRYLGKVREEEEAMVKEVKVQSRHDCLLTLCSLFPSVEVASIEAVLERCSGDYAEAYGVLLCSTENLTQKDYGNPWNGHVKLTDKLRLKKLCDMFPNVPEEVVSSTFGTANGDFSKATTALNNMMVDMLNTEEEEEERTIRSKVAVTTNSSAPSSSTMDSEKIPSHLLRQTASSSEVQRFLREVEMEMREFGDWRRVRERAYIINSCRLRVMGQATAAYLRGDGKTAKMLSRHGKQLGVEYTRLNRMAMVALEQERLAKNPTSTLDLHGFHVNEVVEVLRRRVQLCRIRKIQQLKIVVGSGTHSSRGFSTIRPAVLEQLQNDPQLRCLRIMSSKPTYFETFIKPLDIHTDK